MNQHKEKSKLKWHDILDKVYNIGQFTPILWTDNSKSIKSLWITIDEPSSWNKIRLIIHCDEMYESEPQISLLMSDFFGAKHNGDFVRQASYMHGMFVNEFDDVEDWSNFINPNDYSNIEFQDFHVKNTTFVPRDMHKGDKTTGYTFLPINYWHSFRLELFILDSTNIKLDIAVEYEDDTKKIPKREETGYLYAIHQNIRTEMHVSWKFLDFRGWGSFIGSIFWYDQNNIHGDAHEGFL